MINFNRLTCHGPVASTEQAGRQGDDVTVEGAPGSIRGRTRYLAVSGVEPGLVVEPLTLSAQRTCVRDQGCKLELLAALICQ